MLAGIVIASRQDLQNILLISTTVHFVGPVCWHKCIEHQSSTENHIQQEFLSNEKLPL